MPSVAQWCGAMEVECGQGVVWCGVVWCSLVYGGVVLCVAIGYGVHMVWRQGIQTYTMEIDEQFYYALSNIIWLFRHPKQGSRTIYFIFSAHTRRLEALWVDTLSRPGGISETNLFINIASPRPPGNVTLPLHDYDWATAVLCVCIATPANTKHLYNICTTSTQRLWRWFNIVQMLYKCFVFAGTPSTLSKPWAKRQLCESSIVGSLRDREVGCSASDRQGFNFESCVWRTESSHSSHHPRRFSWPSLAYTCAQRWPKIHTFHLRPRAMPMIMYYWRKERGP